MPVMTDLQELWDKRNNKEISSPVLEEKDIAQLKESIKSPIQILKRNFIINTAFALLILLGFIYLFFTVDWFLFRLFTAILCISYVAAIVFNVIIYKRYLQVQSPDQPIITYLTFLVEGMRKSFKAAEIIALAIYPIAMTAGFLLPLSLENKLSLLYNEPIVQGILIACYVLLTPLCWYLARWMNKVAFGNYVDQLDELLFDLKKID